MFSDDLIQQLSLFIIRPHRQIYGLDRLGPKKLVVKSASMGSYLEINRYQATITSNGKKLQISIFQPQSSNSYSGASPKYNHFHQEKQTIMSKSTEFTSMGSIAGVIGGYDRNQTDQISIFLHSNSGSRIQGLQYIKYLLQYEQRVCLFDYSGSGLSEGEFVTMGIRESEDLQNVINFLKNKYQVEKVNLWGRSMGAATALLYACRLPNNVNKLVLDSPFCNFKQLVKQIVNTRTGFPDFLFGTAIQKIQQEITKKLGVNLMELDLKKNIQNQKLLKCIPCLFLTSKDDKLVKPIHVETLHQTYPGQKRILYLQGSHNKPRPNQIRQQCAQFLCGKTMINSSSKKKIELKKSKFLKIVSRKYSQDVDVLNPLNFALNNYGKSGFKFQNMQQKYTQNLPQRFKIPSDINFKVKKQQQNINQISGHTVCTKREEHSVGKLAPSKVSLSQLKKNHFEALKKPIIKKTSQRYEQGQLRGPRDKPMAIQFKNKIKQHNSRH